MRQIFIQSSYPHFYHNFCLINLITNLGKAQILKFRLHMFLNSRHTIVSCLQTFPSTSNGKQPQVTILY